MTVPLTLLTTTVLFAVVGALMVTSLCGVLPQSKDQSRAPLTFQPPTMVTGIVGTVTCSVYGARPRRR